MVQYNGTLNGVVMHHFLLSLSYYYIFLIIKPRDPSKTPSAETRRDENTREEEEWRNRLMKKGQFQMWEENVELVKPTQPDRDWKPNPQERLWSGVAAVKLRRETSLEINIYTLYPGDQGPPKKTFCKKNQTTQMSVEDLTWLLTFKAPTANPTSNRTAVMLRTRE